MRVENENSRLERPEECDWCQSAGTHLERFVSYGPGYQVEWLCPYCSVTLRDNKEKNRDMASMFNKLENRLTKVLLQLKAMD